VHLDEKGIGCAATAPQNLPRDRFAEQVQSIAVPAALIQIKQEVTLPESIGDYHLCVYASRDGHEGDPDLVKDAGAVSIARPVVTADVSLSPALLIGGQATVTGTLSSDWPVSVDVYLLAASAACPGTAAQAADVDQFQLGVESVAVAEGKVSLGELVVLPLMPGSYHLCVYASRDGHEGDPDLVKDAGRVMVLRPVVTGSVALEGLLRAGGQAVLSASFSSDAPVIADVYLNEASVACMASSAQNAAYEQFQSGAGGIAVPAGGLAVRQGVTLPNRPGSYHLCVYLSSEGFADDPELVVDGGPLSIDRASVSLKLGLEGFLVPSGSVKVVGTASSDYPVFLTAALNHRDEPCGPNAPANASVDEFQVQPEVWQVAGGPLQLTSNAMLPDTAGTYHLCAYASRDGADADPDLVFDSAAMSDGSYFVQVKGAGSDELVYADGTHGTFRVRCSLANRRPFFKQRLQLSCPHMSGTVRFSYRRIQPRRSYAHVRNLKLSSQGAAVKGTFNMPAGLYRVQIKWKGWTITQTTVRVRHLAKKAR
jgi:hypothetical protein